MDKNSTNISEKKPVAKKPAKKKYSDLDAYLFLIRAVESKIASNNSEALIAIHHFEPTDANNSARQTILDKRDERNASMNECGRILSEAFAALAREKYPDNKEMLKFWHAEDKSRLIAKKKE